MIETMPASGNKIRIADEASKDSTIRMEWASPRGRRIQPLPNRMRRWIVVSRGLSLVRTEVLDASDVLQHTLFAATSRRGRMTRDRCDRRKRCKGDRGTSLILMGRHDG